VKSRIAGDFSGWEQGTVLVLENGQKWEVRDDDPLIASRDDIDNYVRAVDDLRDDTERCEKRIDRLLSRS